MLEKIVSKLYMIAPGPELDRIRSQVIKILEMPNPGFTEEDIVVGLFGDCYEMITQCRLPDLQSQIQQAAEIWPRHDQEEFPSVLHGACMRYCAEHVAEPNTPYDPHIREDDASLNTIMVLALQTYQRKEKVEPREGFTFVMMHIQFREIGGGRRSLATGLWRRCIR